MPSVVVTFDFRERERAVVADALSGVADPVFISDLDPSGRAAALKEAVAVLARNTNQELQPGEPELLTSAPDPVHDRGDRLHKAEPAA